MLGNCNGSDGRRPLSLAIDINASVLLAIATAEAKASASLASWPSRFELKEPDQWIYLWEVKSQ
jgi:hypothetical protein